MSVEYSNKITFLGENDELLRFINNEKYSEYLIKYETEIVELEYSDDVIEIEFDDISQIIDDYEIEDNKYIHYCATRENNLAQWLIEMSNKYPDLYFILDSQGDDDYGFKLELEKGEKKLFIERIRIGYEVFIDENGIPKNVGIWRDINPVK